MTVRTDAGSPIRLGATPVEVRPDGYRVYRGTATYGDVVLDYPEWGRSEFRPAAEVLSPEAVRSMIGVPFTLHHPDDLLDADDPEAIARHQVGTVLRAEADMEASPPALKVDVIVHSRRAQQQLEDGLLAELSPGYRCKEVKAPPGASHAGKAYQTIQTGHRNNHLSGVLSARTITPDGRRARLDAADAATYPPQEHATMDETAATTPTTTDAPIMPDDMLAAFPPDDAVILKTLSPQGLAVLMEWAAKASGEAAEEMAEEMVEAGEVVPAVVASPIVEEVDGTMPAASAALTADAVAKICADTFKSMMAERDAAMPTAPAAASPKRADGLTGTSIEVSPRIDADAVVARVREDQRRDAAFVDHVRKDGAADVVGIEAAATHALRVIQENAERLHARAVADLKAGRMDDFRAAYDTAEDARRDRLVNAQASMLASVATDDGRTRRPAGSFTMPTGAATA